LVRLESGMVTLRPIAGTRPRAPAGSRMPRWSANCSPIPRSAAEHVMLMDLGRNDVGRVAQVGSVRVTENMTIERYRHVMPHSLQCRRQAQTGLDAMAC